MQTFCQMPTRSTQFMINTHTNYIIRIILMTSAGRNFNFCSIADAKDFRSFFIKKLRIFHHRLLGIPKEDNILYLQN